MMEVTYSSPRFLATAVALSGNGDFQEFIEFLKERTRELAFQSTELDGSVREHRMQGRVRELLDMVSSVENALAKISAKKSAERADALRRNV